MTDKLEKVHPVLVAAFSSVKDIVPFKIFAIEGARSPERQKMLVWAGKSKTLHSKHLIQPDGFCHALDIGIIIDGKANWEHKNFLILANAVKSISDKVDWGGECFGSRFIDADHFQLRENK